MTATKDRRDRLAETQQLLWPQLDNTNTLLPSAWSTHDIPTSTKIDVAPGGLLVRYIGRGQHDSDAAAVRANHPIPEACGVYYFEITVKSKGCDGFIGIGLCAANVSLDRLPGWEKNSYGYHGDDGHSFRCHGTGTPYGPKYTTGDVVGCCVNFVDHTCFYTKNGVSLGVAFDNVHGEVYPSVGMRTLGECLEANFGHSPFVFDIYSYIKDVRASLRTTVRAMALPPHTDLLREPLETPGSAAKTAAGADPGAWTAAMNALVIEYLIHGGYTETAQALVSSQEAEESNAGVASMHTRRRIRDHILKGEIEQATASVEAEFPGLLEANDRMRFALMRQQFVEMIAQGKARASDMASLQELLQLGQRLQSLRSTAASPVDDDKNPLEDVFGLLAYEDPYDSPVAAVLDVAARARLANEVNSRILETQSLPARPALETLLRQVHACLDECVRSNAGTAALVSPDDML